MISIVVIAIYALMLLIIGYSAVCGYLKNGKIDLIGALHEKITKKKILYLIAGTLSSVLLIVFFKLIYHQDLITQFKLISVILIILPNAAVDYSQHKMPNIFMLGGLAIRLIILGIEFVISVSSAVSTLLDGLLGAGIIGVFFLLIMLIFKNSIGMGDVKLFAIMGLFQGLWGAVCSVFCSLVITFFVSIYLLIAKKKKKKDVIAFGPSIFIGTVASIALTGM